MAPTRMLLLATLQTAALASFSPLPFHHYAEQAEKKGTQRYSHEEHHLLPGGTALSLSWSADADPDTILGLDTEHMAGVRLAQCKPDQLVLHLPASHVGRAKAWKHVTASILLHNCEHLEDHPLYHRIESMEFTKHHDTPKGGATVVMSTKELYSVSQVLPNVDFTYAVTPIDALHPDDQDEARSYYAQQAIEAKERKEALAVRRLDLVTGDPDRVVTGKPAPLHFNWNSNSLDGFKSGFKKSVGAVTVTNSFTTGAKNQGQFDEWKPMTHANFGWNWNYHTNTTRNPQFKFTLPGMKGYVLLKNPYFKFLGLFHIKFNSKWNGTNPFGSPPHVRLNATLEGNAFINADLSLMADIYRDVAEDPLGRFHIPLLNNFTKETHYFKACHFFIASIPVTLQPGVSVNLNAYHLGLFKGAVRLGVNVHLRIAASAQYDSLQDNAMHMEFRAEALNVRMLPPSWMIYTKHLEFGALLTPTFWLKGGVGPVRDVTLQLQLKPYMNVSVTQEGQETYGIQQQVLEKELVVVPFRAVNLPLGTEWSVGIEANGRRKMTSTELSMGVVEFKDYAEHFRFGQINQRKLLREPINVCLFKNGVYQTGKVVPIYCESVVQGECQPAPFNAEFLINSQTVIVQLTLAWHADPVSYLMSKVRSMSIVFPQLALSREASADFVRYRPEKVYVKITRNGREYRAYHKPRIVHAHLVVIESQVTQDLGVCWIDAWRINYGTITGQRSITNLIDPAVELYYVRNGGEQRVAHTFLPNIDWDTALAKSAAANNMWSDQTGTGVGKTGQSSHQGLLGKHQSTNTFAARNQVRQNPREVSNGKFFVGNVPLKISMAGVRDAGSIYSTGHMGIDVHSPVRSNRWLRPHRSEQFIQGTTHSLFWATRFSVPGTAQSFVIRAYRLDALTGRYTPTSMVMNIKQACKANDPLALKYLAYGKECTYSQKMNVQPGLVGVTVVFQIRFRDIQDKTIHKMMSPPVSFVSAVHAAQRPNWGHWGGQYEDSRNFRPQGEKPQFSQQRKLEKWGGVQRKLSQENGNTVLAPENSDSTMEFEMADLPLLKEDKKEVGHESLTPRRLGAPREMGAQFGYAPSNISFSAKMDELHPICTKKPLHYSIEVGIFFRAKVLNFHLSGNQALGPLTPIANLISVSNLDTKDIPLANTQLGKKLQDIFPKGLCLEGVCDGTLPGCPAQLAKSMVIPKVEFKLNRNFMWNAATQQKAKEATAYAMALTPEVIRITSLIATSLMHETTTRRYENDQKASGVNNVIYVKGQPCAWTARPECSNIFNYRGIDYQGCAVTDHGDRGWCSVGRQFTGNWRNCWVTCRNQYGQHYTIKHLDTVKKAWGHKGKIGNQTTLRPTLPPKPMPTQAPTLRPVVHARVVVTTQVPTPVEPQNCVAGAQNFVVGAHIKVDGEEGAEVNGHVGTMIGMEGATMVKVNFQVMAGAPWNGIIGLKIVPKDKCTVVHCDGDVAETTTSQKVTIPDDPCKTAPKVSSEGGRRLEEKKDDDNEEKPTEEAIQRSKDIIAKEADPLPEVDRFYIEIDPKGLSYKIDEDLMQELLRRKAFRGIEDGREKELGEAKITHFKLHRSDLLKHVEDDDTMIAVQPEAKFEWDSHVDYEGPKTNPQAKFAALAWVVAGGTVAGVAVLSLAALAVSLYRIKRNDQVLPYVSVEEEACPSAVE